MMITPTTFLATAALVLAAACSGGDLEAGPDAAPTCAPTIDRLSGCKRACAIGQDTDPGTGQRCAGATYDACAAECADGTAIAGWCP